MIFQMLVVLLSDSPCKSEIIIQRHISFFNLDDDSDDNTSILKLFGISSDVILPESCIASFDEHFSAYGMLPAVAPRSV